jgi:hypothetical protein
VDLIHNSPLRNLSLRDWMHWQEDLSSLSESADEEESMGCWAPRSKKVVVCKPVQLKRVCIFGIRAVRCHTSIWVPPHKRVWKWCSQAIFYVSSLLHLAKQARADCTVQSFETVFSIHTCTWKTDTNNSHISYSWLIRNWGAHRFRPHRWS